MTTMLVYATMATLAETFAQNGYVVYRACLKDLQLSLLYRYACKRADQGTMGSDPRSPGAAAAAGDVFMDALLVDFLPIAEEITQLKLWPTYSYFRVYKRGDILVKHTDRPSCEFSLTVCLGYDAEKPWPLLLDSRNGVSAIELMPGDGMLYRGTEHTHWRDPFEGERAAQVFLHYVNQDGPHAEWKYDKRKELPFYRPKLVGEE